MMKDLFGNEYTITAQNRKNKFVEYDEFVDKFKPKLTTDDCYTPELVFNAVLDWVKNYFRIADTCRIVRPFWPGGDYLAEDYTGDCVVVDNPPFSILSKIIDNYNRMGVRFFLFAPYLTLFGASEKCTVLPIPADIKYQNGAIVKTSFVTNLSPELAVLGSVSLYNAIKEANEESIRIREGKGKDLPRYEYPENVLTSTMVGKYIAAGVNFNVKRAECVRVAVLDAQRKHGKSIFGSGLFISNRAAAEKAAAEKAAAEKAAAEKAAAEKALKPAIVWELSAKEKEIIKKLSK